VIQIINLLSKVQEDISNLKELITEDVNERQLLFKLNLQTTAALFNLAQNQEQLALRVENLTAMLHELSETLKTKPAGPHSSFVSFQCSTSLISS